MMAAVTSIPDFDAMAVAAPSATHIPSNKTTTTAAGRKTIYYILSSI